MRTKIHSEEVEDKDI